MKTKVKSASLWLKTRVKNAWHLLKHPQLASSRTSAVVTAAALCLTTLILFALCLLCSTLDLSRGRFSSYFHEPTIFLLNLLPCVVSVAFLYFVTNRAWIAYAISAPILLLICFVNYFKVALRGDPFRASDLASAGEGMGILGQYELQFPWVFFAAIVLWLGGAVLLRRYARYRVNRKRWYLRVIAALACIGVSAYAWCAWYSSTAFYYAQNNSSLFNLWKDAENYASHGTLYSFIHSINDAISRPPEGYSEEKAQEILSAYSDADIPEDEKVNVVITMIESFCDLSEFEQIKFVADPYGQYHAFLEECYTGKLIADSVGGETINAERAFLTGFTYPQPSYTSQTNSFVRYFASQGYQTDGSHPGHDWFYSRNLIDERLGFEQYRFMENHYQKLTDEEYAYDRVLYPELAEIYGQETADGQPYFSFTVTYQNHSPYNAESLDGAEFVSHEGISDEAYYMINNYLNSVNDGMQYLIEYVDSFRDDEAPVVMLFFGDHKPTFGTGNCYYEEMGINVAGLSPEGCENLYTTPYFIWANDAAKEILDLDFSAAGKTLSPAFLMSELFDFCGWEGPAWMQYQRTVREVIPVMHRAQMYMVEGVLSASLSDRARKIYEEYKIAEYYQRTVYTGT